MKKLRGPRGEYDKEPRENHYFACPTVGAIHRATFRQSLTGQARTVEIVRFYGAEVWKARIVETQSVITRLGYQAEFVSAAAAKNDLTRYLQDALGLEIIQPWKEDRGAAPCTLHRSYGAAMELIQ